MKKNRLRHALLLVLIASMLWLHGCGAGTSDQSAGNGSQAAPTAKANENVYKGKIVGTSNKAKSISISVGKGKDAKTMMVRFDAQTTGVEYAKKGEAAVIHYRLEGDDKIATVIKPKLAKLPQGTSEMQPDELADVIDKGVSKYFLVDSRPAPRFHEGSIETAVSIPVPELKKHGAALLPSEKSTELIFFCGGVT